MRVFVTVVESGSFAKAADTLQMGRPAVTLAIKALESELGVRLLHRTTRKTSLTAEGTAYFERSVRILADVAQAREDVSSALDRRSVKGRLRVDIPVALGKALIIPALKPFRDAYPHIELVIGVSDNPVDLVAEGVDCVVRIGSLADSSLVARGIGRARLVVCGAPTYLAQRGEPRNLDDLTSHTLIGFFSGRSRKMLDWSFIVDGRETAPKLKPSILVNDSEALVEAGVAGLGLLQALDVGVRRQIEAGTLQVVLGQVETPTRPISVLLPSKRHVPPQVRVFVDWMARLMNANLAEV